MSSAPLLSLLQTPGFTPGQRHLDPLLELLANDDKTIWRAALRALSRLGLNAAKTAQERLPHAEPSLRARMLLLLGRIAQDHPSPDTRAILIHALSDPTPKVRRYAVEALSKLSDTNPEDELLALWSREDHPSVKRSIADALGKIGGPRSLELLRTQSIETTETTEATKDPATQDPELRKTLDRAVLMLSRTMSRTERSEIQADVPALHPVPVLLHCRAGLEDLLLQELDTDLHAHAVGPGMIRAQLRGAPSRLFQARTMLWFGFPLAPEPIVANDIASALVTALTSPEARRIFERWTAGTIRFRIAWVGGGHKRAVVWQAAQQATERWSALRNDPTESTWEALTRVNRNRLWVELRPRALIDPRFSYRQADVPAASHPTLAAALARVAEVRKDDVVWDPFVGSGLELIERARLGPYAKLYGSDRDPAALDKARVNLKSAGLQATLSVADARTHTLEVPATLLITNPPMGRRVVRHQDLAALLDAFVTHAAHSLARAGRLVWVSPLAERTVLLAQREGLRCSARNRVDMGGFHAEIQRFEKP